MLALTPLCLVKAEGQSEQLALLKKESSWSRGDFVVKAGWVANVNEKYRSEVARACATALVEALDAKPCWLMRAVNRDCREEWDLPRG